jgi:peptidoglycan/LPS O-acetylase OafA/YrhL
LFLALWTIEDLHGFIDLDVWRLILRSLLYGAASVLVIVGLAAFEIAGRLKQPRALVVLGGASYLLYLIHVPALLVLGASERHLHLLRFVSAPVLGTLFVLATIGGAVVMHIVVERPMLGWVRRMTGRKLAAAAPATA